MKLKKVVLSAFLVVIVLFTSCSKKEYYINLPSDVYSKISEKTVYEDKKLLVKLIDILNPESYENLKPKKLNSKIIASISTYKEYAPLLKDYFESEVSAPFIVSVYDSSKNEIVTSDRKETVQLEKHVLFPCLPFSENMPLVIDDSLLNENKEVKFYFINDIPMGNIALPYSAKPKSEGVNDLRAMDAIYPDSDDYPFYQKVMAECKSLIPAEKENKKSFVKLAEITFNWFNDNFYNTFYIQDESPSLFFTAATGDIMIARGVEDILIDNESPDKVFNDTLKVLQHNDFTMGNLEGVVTTRWDAAIKTYTFKFKKKALPQLKAAGYDYFMITNNHSYDYGEVGFKDTLAALKEYDFKYSGAGYNKDEAKEMYSTTIKNTPISVLSVGAYPVEMSGFNGAKTATATDKRAGILWKSEGIYEEVKKAKARGDFVIINAHAGSEYVKKPNAVQKEFYEKLCDSGADVIFGSHPHILQDIEWYNNSLIVWSLGNFVFPGMEEMPGAEDSMIVRIGVVNGRLLYYQKYPAKLNGKTVDLK